MVRMNAVHEQSLPSRIAAGRSGFLATETKMAYTSFCAPAHEVTTSAESSCSSNIATSNVPMSCCVARSVAAASELLDQVPDPSSSALQTSLSRIPAPGRPAPLTGADQLTAECGKPVNRDQRATVSVQSSCRPPGQSMPAVCTVARLLPIFIRQMTS